MNKRVRLLLGLGIMALAYGLGAYSHPRGWWPLSWLRQAQHWLQQKQSDAYAVDRFGRFADVSKKVQVQCPVQNADTVVVLVAGQSNAANHGEHLTKSRHANRVLNHWNGRCYQASSPLLGATGIEGEYITALADELIDSQQVSTVLIQSVAVTGTPIARWEAGGDLNRELLSNLKDLSAMYAVTDVIWHQGESDYANLTSADNYQRSFHSLRQSLVQAGVFAPIWLVGASKCGFDPQWHSANPVAQAHSLLGQSPDNVRLAISTDAVFEAKDRRADGCHLSQSGQQKLAHALAQAVLDHRAPNLNEKKKP